jgi:hypothetical protein
MFHYDYNKTHEDIENVCNCHCHHPTILKGDISLLQHDNLVTHENVTIIDLFLHQDFVKLTESYFPNVRFKLNVVGGTKENYKLYNGNSTFSKQIRNTINVNNFTHK